MLSGDAKLPVVIVNSGHLLSFIPNPPPHRQLQEQNHRFEESKHRQAVSLPPEDVPESIAAEQKLQIRGAETLTEAMSLPPEDSPESAAAQ